MHCTVLRRHEDVDFARIDTQHPIPEGDKARRRDYECVCERTIHRMRRSLQQRSRKFPLLINVVATCLRTIQATSERGLGVNVNTCISPTFAVWGMLRMVQACWRALRRRHLSSMRWRRAWHRSPSRLSHLT